MSQQFIRCMQAKVRTGRLSRQMADQVEQDVAALEAQFSGSSGIAVARAQAALQTATRLQFEARMRTLQTALQIQAQGEAVRFATSHAAGVRRGAMALLDRDLAGEGGASNVWARSRAILGQAHALFADGIERLRPKTGGWRLETTALRDMVHHLYGRASADQGVQAAARGWEQAADMLGDRWRRAGGILRDRADWRLPNPAHDVDRIRAAGRDPWKAYLREAIARGDLAIDDFTTGAAITGPRLEELLDQAYDGITTRGLSSLVPGSPVGSGRLANSRRDPRVLNWKTSDGWLAYNDRFGRGDDAIYDALTGHLHGFANDIALVEVLGPNPSHTARLLADTARQAEGEAAGHAVERLFDVVAGKTSLPVNETMARLFAGARAWLTSAQLGGALLSSATDFVAMRQAATWNGLSASRAIARYARLLRSADDRATAVRLGLIADSWTSYATAAIRDHQDAVATGLPQAFADRVLRASGLALHTQALQHAFGMEALGHLADMAGRDLAQLDPPLQRAFARSGIDDAAWNLIRQSIVDIDGARFVDPVGLARQGREAMLAASRLQEMIAIEGRFAVPAPGPLERAMTIGGTRPGTFAGELARSVMQYKGFGLSILLTHGLRGVQAMRGGDHGRYLATFAIGMTLAGALGVQVKAIAQGKDPRDMTDPRFWAAAFMQGGAAGILGDFLYAPTARTGKDLGATLAGPLVGAVGDVGIATAGNLYQGAGNLLGDDQTTNAGRELVNLARRYTPGTTLWYARTAMDRLLWDQLQQLADPKATQAFRRAEKKTRQEYGQRFWWGPGEATPRRPADPRAALGVDPMR